MHEAQNIAIDDPGVCEYVGLSILSVIRLCSANTAERIEVLLGVETLGDTRNVILDRSANFLFGFDAAFTKLLWPFASIAFQYCSIATLKRVMQRYIHVIDIK